MHKYQNYVQLSLYLLNRLLNKKIVIVHIIFDVHLVNNLWANLLINMNIINLKQINTDISS